MTEQWDPRKGQRIAVGWRALRGALMSAPQGLPFAQARDAASASDLQVATCENLVCSARKHGYVRQVGGRGSNYVLTPKGVDAA